MTAAPDAVRALIARRHLGAGDAPLHVGSITLRPHQRSAVSRLRRTIAEMGGALLADDVGLGKTYVALALAAEARDPLIVAPAALRPMWEDAMRAAGVSARLLSYEALSRDEAPAAEPDFLVLDEAHHARTPGAARHARIAALARRARVLLVTATPIHNSRADLAALIALFLGARASALSDDALARCVVRRERDLVSDSSLPDLAPPRWLEVGDDAGMLDAIVALPPAVPPSDGGDAAALVVWSLAHQWASSHGALVAALRRRLARAAAIDAALGQGRRLSRRDLASWIAGPDAVQLALPLFPADAAPDGDALRDALAAHLDGLRTLLGRARDSAWTDDRRAAALRALRARHPGEKIVAFAQYTETVSALFARLRADAGVAALTARGGRVAGGALTRRETIERFAPRAAGAAPPRAIERIDLLLATDLLSEGVSLHDASVVVHLDLPWTPARLEQRVGRSRRMGARHARTAVYALSPPAGAESLLRVEQRLHAKLRAAGRALGVAGTILPSWIPPHGDAAPRRLEALARTMESWLPAPDDRGPGPACRAQATECRAPGADAATVRSPRICALALAADRDAAPIAASLDGADFTEDPATLAAAAAALGGEPARRPAAVLDAALAVAVARAERWLRQRAARRAAGIELPLHAPARRAAMRRIAAIAASAPHHERPRLAPLAASARRAVSAPYGLGAERVLDSLAAAQLPDEAWLRALGAFAELHAPHPAPPPASPAQDAPRLVALLVGVPDAAP